MANASTVNGGTNGSDASNARMSYSVSNGVVTVTAKVNDGYGYTTGRAYLERGKTYIFNCTTNGTWKSASSGDSVEAFLMMSGSTSYEYLRMETNNNFEFTVAETGYYWLRLDVNGAGITHTFSNITIKEKNALNSQSKPVGSQIGSMPIPSRMDYEFDGWYTAASGGTKVTQSTIMSSSNLTLYAHWKSAPTEITYYLSGANGTKQDSGTGNNNMAGATGQNLVNYGLMTTISNRRFSGNIFAEAHQSTSGWLLKMPRVYNLVCGI